MRVIAGSAKGRTLRAPRNTATRPTSDAVREAIFNVLAGLVDLGEASVADLFAGSGALGIEALSRGASHATFVERDRRAVETIWANLAACGFEERATVVLGDARRVPIPPVAVAFADPPYAFAAWDELLERLGDAVVVAEAAVAVAPPHGWGVLKEKRYGGTVVTLLTARSRP